MLIHHNHGVGSEYHIVRVPREDGAGFVAGQPLRVLQRLFIRQRLFGDVGRFDDEGDAGIAQKLGPAWRSGSQNQGHAGTILTGICRAHAS